MKTTYDEENDILYIVVSEGAASDSEELDDDIRVEYDKKSKIVGIEIQDARRNIGKTMAQEIAQQVKAVPR
jgi:uncharacterized protein YuzE